MAARRFADVSDQELLEEFVATRCPRLRGRLIERFLPVAYGCANTYAGRGVPIEDLRQTAVLAMIGALDRYDPARGTAFPTFAVPTINGVLRRYFRDHTWGAKVERGAKDLALRLPAARDELGAALGRSPTVAELSEHLGAAEDRVLLAMTARAAYRSMTFEGRMVGRGSDARSLGESLADPVDAFDNLDTARDLAAAIAALPERERRIVELRMRGWGQAEIGTEIGVSQMHVSRLLRAATRSIAKAMAESPANGSGRAHGAMAGRPIERQSDSSRSR